MFVRYVGGSHIRSISKKDWESVGIDNEDIEVDGRVAELNDSRVVEVSQKAGEYLLQHEAADWEEVTEEEADFALSPAPLEGQSNLPLDVLMEAEDELDHGDTPKDKAES